MLFSKRFAHLASAVSTLAAIGTIGALAMAGCGPSYPNCDEDGDCHEQEFCVDNQCQQCRNDADCSQGQQCNAGRCDAIPGYCQSTSDCPSGQECQNNRCSRVTTTQSETPAPTPTAPQSCQLSAVYFDYESSDLSSSTRDQLQAVANCIRERGIARVTVVGQTDPRGTEEYNLALGDRRARSVRDYLVSLGVARGSLNVTSQGEEMASGNDESGWARDRKTEFVER